MGWAKCSAVFYSCAYMRGFEVLVHQPGVLLRTPTVETSTGGIAALPGTRSKLPRVFDAFWIPSVLAKVTIALASCSSRG